MCLSHVRTAKVMREIFFISKCWALSLHCHTEHKDLGQRQDLDIV